MRPVGGVDVGLDHPHPREVLVEEGLLIGNQQAHDLPLGDGDPHRP